MKRLGILGGTFDPPHYGHLALAENARAQLALDRVLFVPAGQQPLKQDRAISPVHHRVAMVDAAIACTPAFAISLVDVERPGPHYTVDMLQLLRKAYPKAEIFFLIGSDSLVQLPEWRNPAEIVRQANLVVMNRPGSEVDADALQQAVPGIRERLIWLDAPHLDIAASDLRRRVRAGLPIDQMVPPEVMAYILKSGLYTGESE
jgi:nicotinate-nucleotide adenylyltransferase